MSEIILLTDTLVNPYSGDSRYMGPYVLSSQLELSGFDVTVIDYFTRLPNFFEFLEAFLDRETLFIGISSTFLSRTYNEIERKQLLNFGFNKDDSLLIHRSELLWHSTEVALSDWLSKLKTVARKFSPNCQIVLGGEKAFRAIYDHDVYKDIDYVALGTSDLSIVDLARSLREKKTPKYFLFNKVKILDNRLYLDKKICPEMIMKSKYAIQKYESLPIEISRGCVFNCKFCTYDKKESIRKDLDILKREFLRNFDLFGTTVYHFCDDCFNDSRRKVEEVCNMILSLPFKIEWVSYARVDVAIRFPETFELMIESGAKGLFLGLESFNPIVARNAGKGTPIEKVKDFLVSAYKKYGDRCFLQGSFIVGLPGETRASQIETMKWIVENPALHLLDLGVLDIPLYNKNLDKLLVDFSEYSRNPEKYGFKYISLASNTWAHETMTSEEAHELCRLFLSEWNRTGHKSFFRSIWRYPILRTLGYTESEIRLMASTQEHLERWSSEVPQRFGEFLSNYWDSLKKYKNS